LQVALAGPPSLHIITVVSSSLVGQLLMSFGWSFSFQSMFFSLLLCSPLISRLSLLIPCVCLHSMLLPGAACGPVVKVVFYFFFNLSATFFDAVSEMSFFFFLRNSFCIYFVL
jgi:hypothetical protein